MGVDGYAFANVNAVPEIDRAKATVAFTFYVDAGRRAYVRRINISGNSRTRDEVIRRELRQLEDGWYDGTRIERSKVRVRRLGYFEEGSVNLETPPVPGTSDQVDIDFTVAEKNTGNVLAGVGYSSSDGVVFNASISQQNIFGSGNALSLAINTSKHQPDDLGDLRRAVLDGGRRFADARDLRQVHRPQLAVRSRSIRRRRSARRSASASRSRKSTRSTSGFRVEHTNLTLFQQSPPIYYEFVRDFGYVDQQLYRVRRLGA